MIDCTLDAFPDMMVTYINICKSKIYVLINKNVTEIHAIFVDPESFVHCVNITITFEG